MSADAEIRQSMFKVVPHLRAFAISLTGNVDRADDSGYHHRWRASGRPSHGGDTIRWPRHPTAVITALFRPSRAAPMAMLAGQPPTDLAKLPMSSRREPICWP